MIDFNDVNRFLATPATAEALTESIAASEEHVRNITGRSWAAAGDVTDTFYNVREGAILFLTDYDAPETVVVNVYRRGQLSGSLLVAEVQYQAMDKGRVQLYHGRSALVGVPESVQPFSSGLLIKTLTRVTIAYTSSGTIPQIVKDVTAQLAATMYIQGVKLISGLASEKMGDYQYTRGATLTMKFGGDILPAIKKRLRAYSARNRARSI